MTTLKEQRNQLYIDLWEGKRPERVPIEISASQDYALDYYGYSALTDMYNPKLTYELADKMAQMFEGDTVPMAPVSQAAIYRYVKQAFMVPQSNGFFQHPDITAIELDEMPEFAKDPFRYIAEVVMPRVFGILQDDPVYGNLKISIARDVVMKEFVGLGPNLAEKYQRADVCQTRILQWAPFDFIADYIRSFSTILTDMRRKPQWVLDACESVADYEITQISMQPKPDPNKIVQVSMPLHMAPYMRTKDVEKFYFPTYKKVVQGFQDLGFRVSTYAEEDWTPHLEIIGDLPGRCRIQFEKPMPKDVVDKVNHKHIFSTLYPSSILRSGTKEECVNKAKEYLDVLMPVGNYIFAPNKGMLRKNDVQVENVQAVIECVREYGKY